MKKLLRSIFALSLAIIAFNSCSDVPAPFDIPEFTDNNNTTDDNVQGDGTQANPYNIAAVLKIYEDGILPESEVYVRGVITSVNTSDFSTNYGNLTYYIADAAGGSNTFEIFRGYSFNGDKFTSSDQLNVGDTVVVCGTLTLYNNTTKEMSQGSKLISVNGKTGSSDTPSTTGTPKGSGTEADPYNPAKANQVGAALDESGKVENVYVEGIVSEISSISTQYGNALYYITEDGTTSAERFYVFRGYYLNGDKFTSEDQLKVGMKVVVCGDIVNYKGNTVEMAQGSKIISIDGNGGTTTTTTGLNESFESSQGNFTIDNISMDENLKYVWQLDSKYNCMKASAYVNNTNYAAESRLVSPTFSLEGLTSATLTFEHAARYFNDAQTEFKVQASTDGKTWEDLTVSAYPDGSNWTFVTATCDMSKYAGHNTVYIGFLYTSTDSKAGTWEVKNVVVK